MTIFQKPQKGFTMIEILVVIGILAILASIGISSYSNVLKTARDAKRKGDLKSLKTTLESYKANNGSYPSTSGVWWGACTGYGTHTLDYIPGLTPDYIQALPHDPQESKPLPACLSGPDTCYLYRSDGVDFKILAHCAIETTVSATDPFYDPTRPTTSFQVSSSSTSYTW